MKRLKETLQDQAYLQHLRFTEHLCLFLCILKSC